jgi:N-acetylmuramoyl-L-alanine amidase
MAGAVCLAAACSGTARAAVDATTTRANTHGARKIAKIAALSPWEQAERGRDALEAMPEGDRTRADYTRAMDLYRAIYHANPADVHAPAAVNAVAELLAEQGRSLHDAKSSKAAVGQYEFLRTQYPASSLGAQAQLAEGQIEEDELGDKAAAASAYKLLLKEHAKSEQAEEAKAGLASLKPAPVVSSQLSEKTARRGAAGQSMTKPADGGDSVVRRAFAEGPDSTRGSAVSGQRSAVSGSSSLPAMAQTSGKNAKSFAAAQPTLPTPPAKLAGTPVPTPPAKLAGTPVRDGAARDGPPSSVASAVVNGEAHNGKRALVTGIRHWSTATYTRVAIDLGDGVTYEAARVPNPDRIFFDLHGTRLAQELVGKSFLVTDDGFLKRIRAAQYSDDVTRVVLDVNDVTEYSAFLLPNPSRLIIDIHGGKKQGTGAADKGQAAGGEDIVTSAETPAPYTARIAKPTAARPVPNAVATKSSPSEVVDLSEMPGRVDATSEPTSKPISAVVDAGNRDQGTVTPASHDRSPGTPTGNSGRRAAAAADPANGDDAATSGAHQPPARTQPTTLSAKTRKSKAKAADGATVADATPARAAVPTADGETSLVRALGLKIGRIVIDAGHGGHDSGTLGVDGIEEKDVVLDVALRLGKLLSDRLGAEVIYTRSDDTFVPLETRTAIANKAQADLFLSIHANSSPDESARGVETYYLNFTSDPTALDVAARENAVSDQSIHQLSDLVKKIALKDKIAESREFAADVEQSLYGGLHAGNAGLKDRGVKKAPFVVLIGANMPSILAEISFVTNPKDAEQLTQPEYRQRVAESLYKGIARYEGGLSGSGRKEGVATERAAVGQ